MRYWNKPSILLTNDTIYRIRNTLKINSLFNLLYFEKNHDLNKTILVAGTSRSGTTWLTEVLINYLSYRIVFEPFKPIKRLYIPPNYLNEDYYRFFKKILSGKVRNLWVNQKNVVFRPQGRIVKATRANLLLKWLRNNFPEIPIIFILRHPCAVVLSRLKKGWDISLDLIIKQKLLIKDHINPYINIIRKANTPLKRNACLWCIENLTALNTMNSNDWLILNYENLITNPVNQIKRVFDYIGINKECNANTIKNTISSTVRKDSAIIRKSNPLTPWKTELHKENIEEILTIVEYFSLNYLYDKNIMPKKVFK